MIKQDYILRMIERLVQALHYALGLSKVRDFEGALRTLDETFSGFFGWDSNFANSMPEEYLINMLRSGPQLDVDKLIVLAVLFKAEGDVYREMEEPAKAYHRHLRALHLFLTAAESNTPSELSDEWEQTEAVLQALAAFELPRRTLERLLQYHESRGEYAQGEDVLWELVSRGDSEVALNEGIAFYRRLLRRSDEELRAGDLPRREIEEGLKELIERLTDHQP